MKVVIGTRHWLGPDWTHVDADPTPLLDTAFHSHPVDVVCDARHIDLPSGCAELVFSSEALEHFGWRDAPAVVGEWGRLVGAGGRLRIEVPDFLACCQQILTMNTLEGDLAMQQLFFGGQVNRFDYHQCGLTPRILSKWMEDSGLQVVNVERGWEVGWLRVEGLRA